MYIAVESYANSDIQNFSYFIIENNQDFFSDIKDILLDNVSSTSCKVDVDMKLFVSNYENRKRNFSLSQISKKKYSNKMNIKKFNCNHAIFSPKVIIEGKYFFFTGENKDGIKFESLSFDAEFILNLN